MKVVFLDVDGVLNTAKTFERVYNSFKNSGKRELEIDSFRLEYLKKITDETDAKIVLSSTWRRFFQKIDGKIIPRSEKGKLFYEILNWIDLLIKSKIIFKTYVKFAKNPFDLYLILWYNKEGRDKK